MIATVKDDMIEIQLGDLQPRVEQACWMTGLTPEQFCKSALKEYFLSHPTPESVIASLTQ